MRTVCGAARSWHGREGRRRNRDALLFLAVGEWGNNMCKRSFHPSEPSGLCPFEEEALGQDNSKTLTNSATLLRADVRIYGKNSRILQSGFTHKRSRIQKTRNHMTITNTVLFVHIALGTARSILC